MRVHIAVIGGGMNGQLVQMAMPEAVIFDWKPSPSSRVLTRSFGANYLWEPIGDVPCRSFEVITEVDGAEPTLERVSRYKEKIGRTGDVEGWERQFQHRMTGYDFIELPQPVILYNHRIVSIDRSAHAITFAKHGVVKYDHLISTIPLYSLLSLMGMPEPEGRLRFTPIFTKKMPRPPDAPYPPEVMYVNYISIPGIAPYRFCDRFGERHYESIVPFEGPAYAHRLSPGKIFAHPHVPAVLDVLNGHDIWPIGRYGAWNPDELIHETWHDLHRIKDWIQHGPKHSR